MAALRSFGRLQNKVAIVTGASAGIGRAIALLYAKEGATVVCSDLKEGGKANDVPTHEAIKSAGGKSIFVKADAGDADSMKNLVEAAVKAYSRTDIMVNNAGVALEGNPAVPIWDNPVEVYDATMRVNSRGVWLGSKFAGQQMIKQEIQEGSSCRGWIINIASVLGLSGMAGTSAYAASKGSVIGMTRSIAMDYAPFKIPCNVICPGFTQTAMIERFTEVDELRQGLMAAHPLKGIGSVDDIANAAVFLASDDASWVTGVSLPVDGGYVAK